MSTYKKVRKPLAFILSVLLVIQSINLIALAENSDVDSRSVGNGGFAVKAEWEATEFKNGDSYNLVENSATSNVVKMKVSYENKQVSEEGYSAGELVIAVKGIGNVGRDKALEAVVGADKGSSGTKNRDWSYTWNKSNDTYILVNNNDIEPNSVFSGYFELAWEVEARGSVDRYSQNDVKAELILRDGTIIPSNTLSFTNDTLCDTYEVFVNIENLHSFEGLTEGIAEPEKYAYYKYPLDTNCKENSRGVETYRYVFNPDVNKVGSGAIVIGSGTTEVKNLNDGTWEVDLPIDTTYNDEYIFVAYPLDKYGDKNLEAGLSMLGTYFDGDDTGSTSERELAFDSVEWVVPANFSFIDIPGDIYEYWKDTWYDKNVDEDIIIERGGDISGNSLVRGTTETFYLEGEFNKPNDDFTYTFEMVDDFMYILKNDGTYRQLAEGEYEFRKVGIPGASELVNINGVSLEANKYPVKIYAFIDGAEVDIGSVSEHYNGSSVPAGVKSVIVYDDVMRSAPNDVRMPEGTTAVAIRLEDLDVSIDNFSIPVGVDFHINDTSMLDSGSQDNLNSGKVENTSFIKLYQDDTWINTEFDESTYIDDTNLNLAQKDLNLYGSYLDREKDGLLLYAADMSDYGALAAVGKIEQEGNNYYTTVSLGSDFSFSEDDDLSEFSLYTILPEDLEIRGYDIEEDVWNIFTFSGFDLDNVDLASRISFDIDEDYKDSERTYIGIHFDLSDVDVPKKSHLRMSFPCKVKDSFFEDNKSVLLVKDALVIDNDIYEYPLDKYLDNGEWDTDSDLFKDIDNDGIVDENLSYGYGFTAYIYADSSELQMSKSVKTSASDGYVQLPEVPLAEGGTEYSYELSVRNGASLSKNIVITDILETGDEAEWQGTFLSIDMSDAVEKGMEGTVWYSDSSNPGELGSSSWVSSLDANRVKAVAVDFGESELGENEEVNIYINMLSPLDDTLFGKVTENNFSSKFVMIDGATGNESEKISLLSNDVKVMLSAELKTLVATKVDATDGKILRGAKFALVNSETGEIVAEEESNVKGQVIFKNIPGDVKYFLREIVAPVGYKLSGDVEIIFGDSNKLNIKVENSRKTGTVVIHKTNSLDNLIFVEGAEYGLYTEEGTEVASAVTDINGKAELVGIEWGRYYIQEKVAPEGYSLDDTKHSFEINKDNVDSVVTLNIKDKQSGYTSVKLSKYVMTSKGVQTDIPLQGVVFKLVNVTGGRETSLGTYVTDKNGEIFVEELPYGDYKFIETVIPVGYDVVENVSFSISPDNLEEELTVYNKRESGSIIVYKTDNLGNIVKGAVFELYDSTKSNVIGTYETNEYGNILIEDLEWGTYYLKEKSAPECYVLNEDWFEASVSRTEKTVYLNIVNETEKGTIVLTKTDEIGNARLEGAEFNLYSGDGKLLEEGLVTDENGELRVDNLEWGLYYFKETKAPENYTLSDETIRFAVNSSNAGVEQSLMVVNHQDDSKYITITKKLVADDIHYPNGNPTFLFKVVGDNGEVYYRIMKFDESYVTANMDSSGYVSQSVTVSGLVSGEYVVTEEESSRYVVNSIEGSQNVSIVDGKANVNLRSAESGEVIFSNHKYEHGNYSDNQSVANVLKGDVKLTAIKVQWLGDDLVEAKSEIDRSLVKVVAIYDDGSSKELGDNDWSFGDSFDGSKFPNINGDYLTPIKYSENGVVGEGSFVVTIYGAVREVVKLEASVVEGYETVTPGASLSNDMFNVVAVYNDSSRVTLGESDIVIDKTTAPSEEGVFTVKIKLSTTFEDHNDTVETDVNLSSRYPEPILVSGNTFEDRVSAYYPNIIGITFTDEVATSDSIRDFSVNKDGSVVAWEDNGVLKVSSQRKGVKVIGNETCSSMFFEMKDLSSIDVSYLDTSRVTNMHSMFYQAGYNKSDFKIIGLDSWNVGNVTNMYRMFTEAGYKATEWDIDLSSWDVTSVSSMYDMFNSAGYKASSKWSVGNIGKWDMSSVENTGFMFYRTAYTSKNSDFIWYVGDIGNWDTSSIYNMSCMFEGVCDFNMDYFDISSIKTHIVEVDGGEDYVAWDVSNVTNMYSMFNDFAKEIDILELDLSSWDVSSVKHMHYMFDSMGYRSSTVKLNLNGWDLSSNPNITYMFQNCGYFASTFEIIGLEDWDVSGVSSLYRTFYGAGRDADKFVIDLSKWDVSSVSSMYQTFAEVGLGAKEWSLGDLSTKEITRTDGTTYAAWDVSNVTTMNGMFTQAGFKADIWSVGDISNWNTSSVTNMSNMFNQAGFYATWSLDLSSWEVPLVTSYSGFDTGSTDKVTPPIWVN